MNSRFQKICPGMAAMPIATPPVAMTMSAWTGSGRRMKKAAIAVMTRPAKTAGPMVNQVRSVKVHCRLVWTSTDLSRARATGSSSHTASRAGGVSSHTA